MTKQILSIQTLLQEEDLKIPQQDIDVIQRISKKINVANCRAQLQLLDFKSEEESVLTKKMKVLSVINQPTEAHIPLYNLVQNNQTCEYTSLKQVRFVDFPPQMQLKLIPCKPIFFDLAANEVDYPDITNKIKKEKSFIKSAFSRLNFFKKNWFD